MLQRGKRALALLQDVAAAPRFASTWAVRDGEASPSVSDSHCQVLPAFDPPARLLMGPGPANAHPRVLAAQCYPLLGHMHPPYFKIMDDVQEGLRCALASSERVRQCWTRSVVLTGARCARGVARGRAVQRTAAVACT